MATEDVKTDEEKKQEIEKKEKEAKEKEDEEKRKKEKEEKHHTHKKNAENENEDEASENQAEEEDEKQPEEDTPPTEDGPTPPDTAQKPAPNFPGSRPLEVVPNEDSPSIDAPEQSKNVPNFPGARPKGSPPVEVVLPSYPPANTSRQFPGTKPLQTPHIDTPDDSREESLTSPSRVFPGSRPKGSPPVEQPAPYYPPANTSRQFPGTRRPAASPRDQRKRGSGSTVYSTKKLLKTIKRVLQAVRLLTGISGGAIAIIVAVIFLFLVFYILFFGNAGSLLYTTGSAASDDTAPVDGGSGVIKNPPIAGFTRAIEGPLAANYGDNVTYIITYEYDSSIATVPLEDITLIVKFSSNAQFVEASGNPTSPLIGTVEWALSDSKNVSPLTLTLLPNADKIVIVVSLDQKSASTASGVGGNACTAPFEGKGYCTVDALTPTFNGDKTKALIASLICQQESGSQPTRINNNCATKDYSVGLFQINLVAHCAGAYQNQDCNILLSEATRLSCENQLLDSTANIQKMFAISQGTYWKPWTHTWPLAEAKLKSCGIL